jgi:hypothetical protein
MSAENGHSMGIRKGPPAEAITWPGLIGVISLFSLTPAIGGLGFGIDDEKRAVKLFQQRFELEMQRRLAPALGALTILILI